VPKSSTGGLARRVEAYTESGAPNLRGQCRVSVWEHAGPKTFVVGMDGRR
jgi:hypothetical protein